MSCEFLDTPTCPMRESISNLQTGLGEAAKGSSPKELREVVCQDPDRTLRQQGCLQYQVRKGKS